MVRIIPLVLLLFCALPVMADEAKPSFKEKHPKIYRACKKTRVVCHFCLPIVQFAGGVAQVITIFL